MLGKQVQHFFELPHVNNDVTARSRHLEMMLANATTIVFKLREKNSAFALSQMSGVFPRLI